MLGRVGGWDLHVHVIVDDGRRLEDVQAVLGPAPVEVLDARIGELADGVVLDTVLSRRADVVDAVLNDLRAVEGL